MSNTPTRPTFRGKAARIIMAGTLAIAFAPALPAFADDAATATDTATTATDAAAADTAAQVTSWADLYKSLGIDTTSGYDAVTSATNFTGHHVKDIPTIVHRTTNAEGATTSLDGVDASAATAEKTVQVKLGSAEFEYQPDSTHGTGTFLIRPDDTVEGYTWNEYLNNTYAVTVSDGTTTVGAVPWIDYYGENSTSGYHYNKLEVALNNGTSVASNEANVTRFASFYDENGNVKAGTYTITVYSKGYSDLTAQVTVLPTYAGAAASGTSKATSSLCLSNLPSDIQDAKVTVSYTTGHGRNAVTTYLAGSADGGADIPDTGVIALDPAALAAVENGTQLDVVVSNSNYAPISLTSEVADTAVFPTDAPANNWKDFYKTLGVDTTSGYDAVTSATNFTSHHAGDIPTIVNKVTNVYGATTSLNGFGDTTSATQVPVRLQTAVYNDGPSSHYSREFAIYPDDTVSGYNWTDYKNNIYAVTVSDGTTTTGAVPWIDYYGESATKGFHYNKLEIALENGKSIDSNGQTVTRFAKFFDANGNLKTGTYTVTVYAKGYSNLTAQIAVNPSYTGTAAATDASKSSSKIGFTNLPSDIKDAKVTVYHTEGSGRSAVTTYLAGERSSNGIYTGADISADGTVSLDATALAGLATGSDLTVRVDSSNYQTITLTSKVADTATFPNTLKASASTKTVKAKKVAKKKQTVKGAIKVSGAQGKVTYAKVAKGSSKKLSVSKNSGKITVKKGTKKGTYKIKVKVTAAGNADFASASKTVTAKIKVK